MIEPIQISYTVNPKDAATAARAFTMRWKTRKDKNNYIRSTSFLFIISLLITSASYYLRLSGKSDLVNLVFILGLILFLGGVLVNLYIFILYPAMLGWLAKKSMQVNGETTLVMDQDHILEKTKIAESKIEWSILGRMYEIRDYFIFSSSVNKSSHTVIPKRAFVSEEQLAAFRNLVIEKTGAITTII